MNKEEAIKRLKEIVEFYKINDENNYDYSDDVLISMKILLDYITNLQEENKMLKMDNEAIKKFYNELARDLLQGEDTKESEVK